VTELKGYRDQLAKPYFTDEATISRLVREAYDREHFDLRTRHIFVKLAPDALPKDTLEAWQKISKIRERLMNGEAFEKVASEVSEDPSARDREANQQHPFLPGNRGDLGYFTVFDYVYSFESGAYNTNPGKYPDYQDRVWLSPDQSYNQKGSTWESDRCTHLHGHPEKCFAYRFITYSRKDRFRLPQTAGWRKVGRYCKKVFR